MKILYAEDDVMMQKIVVHSLVRLGYEVTTVDDGKEALESVESEEFDLIILDLFMPKMSGFEVVEIIRNELHIDTPILILSRSHLDEAIQKAYTAGANDFIVKPFDPEELIVKITKILTSKR
ncbi:MAG: response regulator [Bacteroidales bacterium]|jgi:CheY-like chemotaxis protein|nr:response regulator [Bacteroidales bacterium]